MSAPHRIIETPVYLLDQLSDAAKEKARAWYRSEGLDYDWWGCVYDDIDMAARLLGVTFDRHATRNPGATGSPRIYFSGFYHQGEGSSFVGTYRYAKGAARAVAKEFPTDGELLRIARELQAVQARAFYALSASISAHRDTSISVAVEDMRHNYGWCSRELERDLTEALRDFNGWIFERLRAEYEYLTSDEAVDEALIANEYEFTESGDLP